VVLAAGLVQVHVADGRSRGTSDLAASGGRTSLPRPFACGSGTRRSDDVSRDLPAGSIAARLCYRGNDGRDGVGRYLDPPTILTEDVDDLVRTINALPTANVDPRFQCSGVPGVPEYRIVLRYRSGTRTVQTDGCGAVLIGPFGRAQVDAHGTSLERSFWTLLDRQLSRTSSTSRPADCPRDDDAEPRGAGDLQNVVAARWCGGAARASDRLLGPDELIDLQMSQRPGSSSPRPGCLRADTDPSRLVLRDIEGNDFVVVVRCHGRFLDHYALSLRAHHPASRMFVNAGPALGSLLRGLAAG
jgi:hypothetical protein